MHTIHHTRAVILKSQPSGESNKLFWLFTEELGLIVAVATGVRKSTAKLRGQLVEYAFVIVDLVQGKDVWRLISATLEFNPLADNQKSILARPYVRTLGVLERFLIGEGTHPELFAHIDQCARYLLIAEASAKAYDTLAIWRTLVHLGYIAVPEDKSHFFILPFAEAMTAIEQTTTKEFIVMVNSTIRETHL